MKTIFRRAKSYAGGLSTVDRGYTKPKMLDGTVASGSISQGNYGGVAPVDAPTGPALTGDLDSGKLWVYLNGEWVFTGVTVSL